MIKVGIVGGTGYTGVELLRLLAQHPGVQLAAITSRKEAGMAVADLFPSLRGRVELAFSDPADAPLAKCDVVFFATPNGVAMGEARLLVEAGVRFVSVYYVSSNNQPWDTHSNHNQNHPKPSCSCSFYSVFL